MSVTIITARSVEAIATSGFLCDHLLLHRLIFVTPTHHNKTASFVCTPAHVDVGGCFLGGSAHVRIRHDLFFQLAQVLEVGILEGVAESCAVGQLADDFRLEASHCLVAEVRVFWAA